MKLLRSSRLARSSALAVVALCAVASAPGAANAGRPTIFDLQDHLKQLPEKQRAREAAERKPANLDVFDAKTGRDRRGNISDKQ